MSDEFTPAERAVISKLASKAGRSKRPGGKLKGFAGMSPDRRREIALAGVAARKAGKSPVGILPIAE